MKSAQRRSLLEAPAIQALLILSGAFLLALSASQLIQYLFTIAVYPAAFAVMQGALATWIAYRCRMASWWMLILFCFPSATIFVNALQLPPILFLSAFLFLLLLFWSTFRSQVPFYPSGRPVWDAVADLLPTHAPVRFMDIGSGLGGAVLYLSRKRADGSFTGIEVAPLPWLVSQIRALMARSRGRFTRGDYMRLAFADYDVIFAYLSPAAMAALWQKARVEMRPGTLLLSYEFPIDGMRPDVVAQPQRNGPLLYGWRM